MICIQGSESLCNGGHHKNPNSENNSIAKTLEHMIGQMDILTQVYTFSIMFTNQLHQCYVILLNVSLVFNNIIFSLHYRQFLYWRRD